MTYIVIDFTGCNVYITWCLALCGICIYRSHLLLCINNKWYVLPYMVYVVMRLSDWLFWISHGCWITKRKWMSEGKKKDPSKAAWQRFEGRYGQHLAKLRHPTKSGWRSQEIEIVRTVGRHRAYAALTTVWISIQGHWWMVIRPTLASEGNSTTIPNPRFQTVV